MKFVYEENGTIFAICEECGRMLKFKKYQVSEVSTGVECFCGNTSYTINGLQAEKTESKSVTNTAHVRTSSPQALSSSATYPSYAAQGTSTGLPKCPTCGSTKVRKISNLNRGVSVAMWGILSKKINKSFVCDSCGYTW